jgi:hypothetical protein
VACGRVNLVEMLSLWYLVARQSLVNLGQRSADEMSLGVVLAGERITGHPGQQRQPCVTDIDGQLPTGGGDGWPGGYAFLIKPVRYSQAAGELPAVPRGYRLGYPSVITEIYEPGLGAHAAVVRSRLNVLKIPVPTQA